MQFFFSERSKPFDDGVSVSNNLTIHLVIAHNLPEELNSKLFSIAWKFQRLKCERTLIPHTMCCGREGDEIEASVNTNTIRRHCVFPFVDLILAPKIPKSRASYWRQCCHDQGRIGSCPLIRSWSFNRIKFNVQSDPILIRSQIKDRLASLVLRFGDRVVGEAVDAVEPSNGF